MKGFIEVHVNRVERMLNIRYIEIVMPNMGGSCTIYFAFNLPRSVIQDFVRPDESYIEVKKKIEEAMK